MTGLELLGVVLSSFAVAGIGVAGLVGRIAWSERRKQQFLHHVAATLYLPADVESGDLFRPLTFTLNDGASRQVRVTAMLRGDVEVWQLECFDGEIHANAMALVHDDWHAAPDVRALPQVDALTPRLSLRADDGGAAKSFVAHVRAELCHLLGRRTRQCVIGPGRAFLEVTRNGLAVEELRDALLRLDGIVAMLAGRAPRLPPVATSQRAVAGPGGVPVPGFG